MLDSEPVHDSGDKLILASNLICSNKILFS